MRYYPLGLAWRTAPNADGYVVPQLRARRDAQRVYKEPLVESKMHPRQQGTDNSAASIVKKSFHADGFP
jgi:hypothetical protein